MMCLLSATTSSSHYSDEDKVDSEGPRIVTSVGLPQTPPDSDPGSSPVGLLNEEGESNCKNTTADTLAEQVENVAPLHMINATNDSLNILDHIENLSTPSSDKGENYPNQQDVGKLKNEVTSSHNSTKEKNGFFRDFKGIQDLVNDELPSPSMCLDSQNPTRSLDSCHDKRKTKVVSVELPPTPPTMVDEIHLIQKQRRRNSKSGKRKLRLSVDIQEENRDTLHQGSTSPKELDFESESSIYKKHLLLNERKSEPTCHDRISNREKTNVSDMSSEEDEKEAEKVLDISPFNRYKRVLVKNGEGGWLLQFVSPCGRYRFNSQKELALNLGENIDDLENTNNSKVNKSVSPPDPFAQKLTILRKRIASGLNHFIRQSLDECALRAQRHQIQSNQNLHFTSSSPLTSNHSYEIVNPESRESKDIKTAPFTFVNMRQNIFDMTASKRKRILASHGKGIKGKRYGSKEWIRRNSIAAIHCSTNKNNGKVTKEDKEDKYSFPISIVPFKVDFSQNEENVDFTQPSCKNISVVQENSATRTEDYKLCESIITSILYSCVQPQCSVENRLHPSQNVETNLEKLKTSKLIVLESNQVGSNSYIQANNTKISSVPLNKILDSSNDIHNESKSQEEMPCPRNENLDICNSRSITSSNRIAIVQHHDVPIKQVTSLETHNSNSINCDIVGNQTVVDSPKTLNKNSIYVQRQDGGSMVVKPQNVYCEEQKSPVEDDDDSGVELGPFPFSSLDQDDNVNLGTQSKNKVTLSSKVTTCNNEDLSLDSAEKKFFHRPRKFYSVDKRSMSLDTQLPDPELISLKESASNDVSELPSNKRTWNRNISCDEKLLSKMPKISAGTKEQLKYTPPQMKQRLDEVEVIKINEKTEGDEPNVKGCIAIYEFNENSDSEKPSYRLPWPRSKKQRSSTEMGNFLVGHKAIENENEPHKAGSDPDHPCLSNSFQNFLGSKIEALVIRENVEDQITTTPLLQSISQRKISKRETHWNDHCGNQDSPESNRPEKCFKGEKQKHDRCGQILPVLQETEEIVILGGEKGNYHKISNIRPQSDHSDKNDNGMNNVNNAIERVVNDHSGLETGFNIISSHIGPLAMQQNSITSNKGLQLNGTKKVLVKPAPASKKKLANLEDSPETGDAVQRSVKRQNALYPKTIESHIRINDTISSVIHETYTECSVATMDLFHDSPLENLFCMGCFRKFNRQKVLSLDRSKSNAIQPASFRDSISIDLRKHTLTSVCGDCEWWTTRDVRGQNIEYAA